MTIHTDTYLHSNQDDSYSSSATSAYYSDGGIPYEPNSSSYSIQVDGDAEIEDDDNDDDSSNTNFNYLARDNGSLKTLSSAFSLNDFDSIGTMSSLSVDGEDSDTNGSNHAENPDKRIQFIISPSRKLQRQQRRNSNHSFGRRPRRYSNGSFGSFGSMVKSGDELTEEEIVIVDGSIPGMPNLPNRVGDLGLKRSCSESGDDFLDNDDDMEEVTVEDGQTDDEDVEYFEELLNDPSDIHDDSTKRYEIILSDDSFVEEIILEVEEEEITVEEENEEYTEKAESIADSPYEYNIDSPRIDANCHGNEPNDKKDKMKCAVDECDICDQEAPRKIEDDSERDDQNETPLPADGKVEITVDSRQSDGGNQDATPTIAENSNHGEKKYPVDGHDKKSVKDPGSEPENRVESQSQENGNGAPRTLEDGSKTNTRKFPRRMSYKEALIGSTA